MKSPINYAHDHAAALMLLKTIIPKGSIINSFLFYSGLLEFSLCSDKRFVNCHTSSYVVYEFWHFMLEDSARVRKIIESRYFQNLNDEKIFNLLQENWHTYRDPYTRTALFLLLNWSSETGLISSGKFQKAVYNPLRLEKVSRFNPSNFHLSFLDPRTSVINSISSDNNCDYLLIPAGRFNYNLFEHGKSIGREQTTINHADFFSCLKELTQKWIVLYKNHDSVHKMYKDFNIKMIDKYGNITNQDNCEDIIVTNF